ncbi:MarR family winged helix-turn-helix transcriptional regulator [Paraburkholderia fungorum]|nr:MarR family winged helix-turn-helix transcriptional regulator [Paraburkholderia fungorum]
MDASEDLTSDFRLVFRVQALVKRLVNQKLLSVLGITFSQGSALLHLARSPEVSCQELAQLLGCGTSRISRLVHDLEKRRLIESRRGGADRRVLQLALTADGAALAYRVPVVLRDAEQSVLAVLPGNEQRCLLKFLSRLAANIDRSECAIEA